MLKKIWENTYELKDRKAKLAEFNAALKKGHESGDFSDATKMFLGDDSTTPP